MIEKIHVSEYGQLNKYISQIFDEIKSGVPLIEKRFEDFVDYLPEIGIGPIGQLSPKNISAISIFFDRYHLTSEPRVHMGYIPRRYESRIVIFNIANEIDYSTKTLKFATLAVRLMVLMARADGTVVEKEESEILELVDDLEFLSADEKTVIKARAICQLSDKPSIKVDFYDYSINKIVELDSKSQDFVIELIKNIAVCDGYIDREETNLLRDIYKSLELPTDNVKKELTLLAKSNRIELREFMNIEMDRIINQDVDLDDMDFDVDQILFELDD